MGLVATIIEAPEELRDYPIPPEHKAVCDAQNIPVSGNAAGNTDNVTDLSGANAATPNPDNG
jgi:iron transport multicopper oxidase